MSEKVSILLVDDEPIVGKRLKPALERIGYDVETCDVGSAALDRLRQRHFDIVVTDMRIDEVTGLDVLQAAQEERRSTKVIVITGYATIETAREALSKGAFEVIAKPFRPKDLQDSVAKAVKALGAEKTGR